MSGLGWFIFFGVYRFVWDIDWDSDIWGFVFLVGMNSCKGFGDIGNFRGGVFIVRLYNYFMGF